jgi:hypothetical protein
MKKYSMAALICLASSVAFCQTNESVIREHAKDPNMLKMAAIADTMLIDKKVIADDSKKPQGMQPDEILIISLFPEASRRSDSSLKGFTVKLLVVYRL